VEYTKGEWLARGSRVIILDKEGFVPSSYWPVYVIAQTSTYCDPDDTESQANARLIAAAPDYDKAVSNMIQWYISKGFDRELPEFRAMQAAKAKAEGK